MEVISAEIDSVASKKENLRRAFEELRSHSDFLSLPFQWKDLESYFDPIEQSIRQSFEHLKSKERQQQLKKSQSSVISKPLGIPESKSLHIEVEGQGVRTITVGKWSSIEKFQKEVGIAVRHSRDPARLVLDLIDGLNDWPTCIFLLQNLLEVPPPFEIDHVKLRAMGMAGNWKVTISQQNVCGWRQVLSFLRLVAAYDLASGFDADELLDQFEFLSKSKKRKKALHLSKRMGLEDKIPGFVQKMVSKGNHLEALDFVQAYELQDQFPPASLLESFLKETEKAAGEICRKGNNSVQSQNEATEKEIAALRLVIRCIEEHKLQSECSIDKLLQQMQKLEKRMAELKKHLVDRNNLQNGCLCNPNP